MCRKGGSVDYAIIISALDGWNETEILITRTYFRTWYIRFAVMIFLATNKCIACILLYALLWRGQVLVPTTVVLNPTVAGPTLCLFYPVSGYQSHVDFIWLLGREGKLSRCYRRWLK